MTEKKPLIKTTVENALKVIREYPAHKVAVVVYIRDEDFQVISFFSAFLSVKAK